MRSRRCIGQGSQLVWAVLSLPRSDLRLGLDGGSGKGAACAGSCCDNYSARDGQTRHDTRDCGTGTSGLTSHHVSATAAHAVGWGTSLFASRQAAESSITCRRRQMSSAVRDESDFTALSEITVMSTPTCWLTCVAKSTIRQCAAISG